MRHLCVFSSKASLGPFPWDSSSQESPRCSSVAPKAATGTLDSRARWASYLSKDLQQLPRTWEVFEKIEADKVLSYRLPPPASTAGKILRHATAVFEGVHALQQPMTFKFGFSHCASFRWHNRTYGYKYDVHKFQHMIVVYAAADPVGPAFLEAALIQHYQGHSVSHQRLLSVCVIHIWGLMLNHAWPGCVPNQGTPGCKNIRLGGDTVPVTMDSEGPFLTYFVFRSFKVPPKAKPN